LGSVDGAGPETSKDFWKRSGFHPATGGPNAAYAAAALSCSHALTHLVTFAYPSLLCGAHHALDATDAFLTLDAADVVHARPHTIEHLLPRQIEKDALAVRAEFRREGDEVRSLVVREPASIDGDVFGLRRICQRFASGVEALLTRASSSVLADGVLVGDAPS
jgi:hypothetical protein